MSESDLLRAAVRTFEERHGRAPTLAVAAPGRVNLIGEHTDYNGGLVLPMAIDRQAVMVAAPTAGAGRQLRVYSVTVDDEVSIPVDGEAPAEGVLRGGGQGHWGDYLRGVVAGLRGRGKPLPALDAVLVSNVRPGAGLASSGALEVATALLLEAATGQLMDPLERARLCRQAEQDFAGVPCGIMDQLVSAAGQAGQALLIDCQSERWQAVPVPDQLAVLVTDTQVRHRNSEGAYARRRQECQQAASALGLPDLRGASVEMIANASILPAVLRRRAKHVVEENTRTAAAAEALRAGDAAGLGALMYQSHQSLRHDFEVSCAELDLLVNLAHQIGPAGGVFGARMTGGGFGGCTITLVDRARLQEVATQLRAGYRHRTSRDTRPFAVVAAEGARTLTEELRLNVTRSP